MISCSFPSTPFPVCHVRESDRRVKGEFHHLDGNINLHPARLNTVEYGRLSGVTLIKDDNDQDQILFKNHGRHVKVSYNTSCLPLLPPNTATIYDHTPNYDKKQIKDIVDDSFRYFKSSYYRTHVPVDIMIEQLLEETKNAKETESFGPCQGSVIWYTPSWRGGVSIIGYLMFASGPNLNEITFVVLTTPPNCEGEDRGHAPFSLYSDYVRSLDLFQFTYAQSYSCPGLVLELSGIQVQNKFMIGVRCTNHMIILEGPSAGIEDNLLTEYNSASDDLPLPYMACPSLELLKVLVVYRTSVMTSSLALSPYIFGEAVLVTESGGVYLWEEDQGVTPIQSPIATFDVAHYWQCVFGPHPRAVVLAEQASVCLLEFLEDTPTYSLIIDKDSFYMADSVVTCVARHPVNPFYVFIAIGELVLLYDTRQTNEPLLEIRHELLKDIRFITVTCCPWQPSSTHLMLSTLNDASCHAYIIKGGYSVNGQAMPPPYIDSTPHSVDTYTHLLNQLNLISPAVNWRLSRALAGACIVSLPATQRFCGFSISNVGDIFVQAWHYEEQPLFPSPVPHPPPECGLWIEELLALNKTFEQMSDVANVGGAKVTWDFSTVMQFSNSSYANKSVCLRCWTLLKEGGPLEDATLLSDIPPVDVSTLHGTSNAWACSVCRDNVMTSTETNKHITKVEDGHFDAVEFLEELLRGSSEKDPSVEGVNKEGAEPKFEYDEITRLWDMWTISSEDHIHNSPEDHTHQILQEDEIQDSSQQLTENSIGFSQSDSSQMFSQLAKKRRTIGF